MSLVAQLKNVFSPKTPEAEQDSRLSLAMPDATFDSSISDASHDRANPTALSGMTDGSADGMISPVEPESLDIINLPPLGRNTVAQHQKTLLILLGLALVVLIVTFFLALRQANQVAQQLSATGQALMQSQRLAKTTSQAMVGGQQAFPDVADSSGVLAKTIRALKSSDSELGVSALDSDFGPEMDKVVPLMERAEKSAATVMGQQKILTQINSALRLINRQSSDLLEIAESVSSLKLQQNAGAAEISAAGQLVMLTQRIGKSSNEFLTAEGVGAEAVFLLGKDLNSFKEIAQGLLQGSPELRLAASRDPQTREQLDALIKLYEQTRVQAGAILGN